MLKIRFFRTGRKNNPFYRIVVTDSRNAPQGGRFRERLGFFNPLTKETSLNEERIKYWLGVGAQASPRVHNLLVTAKIIEGPKINVLKKSPAKEESEITPAPESEKTSEDKKSPEEKGPATIENQDQKSASEEELTEIEERLTDTKED